MDLNLKDKVAIVTGAGGGAMGTGVCLDLAREGACVLTNDIDKAWADKVAEEVRRLGAKAVPTYADVTKLADCQEMVRTALAEFGRLDILVTVPAYVELKLFVDSTEELWRKTVDVTFWGVVNAVRAALDPMIEQKSGSIVCLGSDAGKVGERLEVIYGTAKAAVMHFAKGLCKEIGPHGIRINVVNAALTKVPQMIESGWLTPEKEERMAQLYPMRRWGSPQDLIDAIIFVASDRASFITGQTLSVSGGVT